MKFILENFHTMTGGHLPGVNKALHHRFIQGFVPHYFNLAAESADANFKQKINPPYPLVLSPDRTLVTPHNGSYPVLIVANEHNALGNVIYSSNLWNIYIDDSSETDLGIPNGTPTSNVGIDLVVFNGKILTSHPTKAALYHGAINATPSWTASTGEALATGSVHLLKNFEDRCLVVDASSGAFTRRDEVKIVLPDFSIINGIELGDTFDIQDIATYQDRYALLFTRKTTSPKLSRNTMVFLWNVVAGDSYDQKVPLKGIYKCSIERDGLVYAFTQIGTTLVCYEFNGGNFREIGRLRNVIISEQTTIPKSRIGIEGDFFVLLATCPGNTSSTSPLYWNPTTGESFFLYGAVNSLPFLALQVAQDPASVTFSYNRYLAYDNGTIGSLFKVTLENSDRDGASTKYGSNFIPAPYDPEIHGDDPRGRIKINRVDIEYNAKAPTSSDIISFTLTTKDELESETYNTHTATIKNTTDNSTNAAVEDKRAIVDDVGALATEFAIDLSVTDVTASWALIIRRIVIDYEPVAHLS